jgi:carbon monoxide dehydrogenase subunit G
LISPLGPGKLIPLRSPIATCNFHIYNEKEKIFRIEDVLIMNIEGTYTLQAPPKDVWDCLMDQQSLQIAIPGVERVEPVDEDAYALTVRVELAPLMGIYHGCVTVTERRYPSFYRITVEGKSDQHAINAEVSVHLNEHKERTVVAYEGTLHLSKAETPLPAQMVKGAAKLLIEQFFTSLSEQLSATVHTIAVTVRADRGKIVLLRPPVGMPLAGSRRSQVYRPLQPTLLVGMLRRLGLGAGDPIAEAKWVDRIRLGSIVLGVLLLVWVGSRIRRR